MGVPFPAALLALGASLRVAGAFRRTQRRRSCSLRQPDFALGQGEILVGVEIAVQPGVQWSYRRATTNGGAFLCAVAGTRNRRGSGSGDANLFLAGGADHPLRLAGAQEMPRLRSDALASGAYRGRLVSVLAEEAIAEIAA